MYFCCIMKVVQHITLYVHLSQVYEVFFAIPSIGQSISKSKIETSSVFRLWTEREKGCLFFVYFCLLKSRTSDDSFVNFLKIQTLKSVFKWCIAVFKCRALLHASI